MQLTNTNVWITKNFSYNEHLSFFLSFGECFSSWNGGGFVVKLIAAKVIYQLIFYFTLSYFFANNIWNKKNVILLVHENHDKLSNVTAVQNFCGVFFFHANLVCSFPSSKYLPKLDPVYCSENEHLKGSVLKRW